MPFIETIPRDEATGEVAALYEEERARRGYLPNYVARSRRGRPCTLRGHS